MFVAKSKHIPNPVCSYRLIQLCCAALLNCFEALTMPTQKRLTTTTLRLDPEVKDQVVLDIHKAKEIHKFETNKRQSLDNMNNSEKYYDQEKDGHGVVGKSDTKSETA